jgi:hypothetical protein
MKWENGYVWWTGNERGRSGYGLLLEDNDTSIHIKDWGKP